jgi:hypothetical protein
MFVDELLTQTSESIFFENEDGMEKKSKHQKPRRSGISPWSGLHLAYIVCWHFLYVHTDTCMHTCILVAVRMYVLLE